MASYEIFDPRVDAPLHTLPRREARAAYKWFISQIPARVELLGDLLLEEAKVELDVQNLGPIQTWFDETARSEGGDSGAPTPYVYSVCNDLGMFLGQTLVEQFEQLSWHFCLGGKRHAYYQRPVIKGFSVENPKYVVDFDYALCAYAHRLAQWRPSEERLLERMYFETAEKCRPSTEVVGGDGA